jgi:hypothetical protein
LQDPTCRRVLAIRAAAKILGIRCDRTSEPAHLREEVWCMARGTSLVSQDEIEGAILLLRGEKVVLDADLAKLYGVTTKALNQAVRRNRDRFPADFMFQLSLKEAAALNRSQIVTGSQKHRDPRYRPFAFTEQGIAMLSSVLRSQRAVQVNIEIMRAFVRLRRILAVEDS